MKKKIKECAVKLMAVTLSVFLAIPAQVFATDSLEEQKIYDESSSIMGIAADREAAISQNSYQSDVSITDSKDYIIKKSATISKASSKISYQIELIAKNPSEAQTNDKLRAIFAANENSNIKDLTIDSVREIGENQSELDYKLSRPNVFNSNPNIETFAISTAKAVNGLVYNLSANIKGDIEDSDHIYNLDMALADEANPVITRYALAFEENDSLDLVIDENGRLIEDTYKLIEVENPSLLDGIYKEETKNIFQTNPAEIKWTDYILADTDKQETLTFDLDENQKTENASLKVEFFEIRESGFILNNSFRQKLPYTNELKLTIPAGQLARVELITHVDTNPSIKNYSLNQKEIPNPIYVESEDKDTNTESESADDDSDPLLNDIKTNSSNDIIADQNDLDFSANPQTKIEEQADKNIANDTDNFSLNDTSANSSNNIITGQTDQDFSPISLNKESLLTKNSESISENEKEAIDAIASSLEAYNKTDLDINALTNELTEITTRTKLSSNKLTEILKGLIAGIDPDKHQVAKLDPAKLTSAVLAEISNSQTTEAREKLGPVVAGPDAKAPGEEVEVEAGAPIPDDIEVDFGASSYDGFENKTFRLETTIDTIAIPQWKISKGSTITVNYGQYLIPANNQKALYYNGEKIATGKVEVSKKSIVYTMDKDITQKISIPIAQDFSFNKNTVKSDPIKVDITVTPENNTPQTQSFTIYSQSDKNPQEKDGVFYSKHVINSGETVIPIGTHTSQNIGNNIRYSVSANSKAVNTYDKAYTDFNNKDLSYYIMLRPEDLGQITGTNKLNIKLTGAGNIDTTSVYRVTSNQKEQVKQALASNQVIPQLNSLTNVTSNTSYVSSVNKNGNNVDITFINDKFTANSSDSFLVKVKAKDIQINQELKFSFDWTNANGTIKLLDNPYSISLVNAFDNNTNPSTPTIPETPGTIPSPGDKLKMYDKTSDRKWMHVVDTNNNFIEYIYCLEVAKWDAHGDTQAISVNNGEVITQYLAPYNRRNGFERSPYYPNYNELLSAVKKVFYYAEDPQFNNLTQLQKHNMIQYALYYVIGGKPVHGEDLTNPQQFIKGFYFNNILSHSQQAAFANDQTPAGIYKPEAVDALKYGKQLVEKVIDTTNWDKEKEASVSLTIYPSSSAKIQNAIGGRVTKKPTPTPKKGKFVIKKTDSKTEAILPGAGFQLFDRTGNTPISDIFTSGPDGLAYSPELTADTYILKEIGNVANYKPSAVNWTVTVDQNGAVSIVDSHGNNRQTNVSQYTITNEPEEEKPQKYSLKIRKVDSENRNLGLANVEIGIYRYPNARDLVGVMTTDTNGYAEYHNLDAGTYYLKEIKGYPNYEAKLLNLSGVDDGTGIVEVNVGSKTTVTASPYSKVNTATPNGGIKTTFSNYKIESVDQNTCSFSTRVTAYNIDQEIKFGIEENIANLDNASYVISERGYFGTAGKTWAGKIGDLPSKEDAGARRWVRYINLPKQLSYVSTRTFDIKITGIGHSLRNTGRASILVDVTDNKGGFNQSLLGANINFETTTFDKTISVANKKIPNKGKLTINKTDGTNPLPNATFTLTKGSQVIRGSNVGSQIVFENLDPGTYELKETSAPEGHKISQDTWEVVVDSETGNVTISKKVPTNNKLRIDSLNTYDTSNIEIDYGAYVNDLGVVTDATAEAEMAYLYDLLANDSISTDEFEYRLKTIVDSLDINKSDFRDMVEPIIADGYIYENGKDLEANVYSIAYTNNPDANITEMVESSYQDKNLSYNGIFTGIENTLNGYRPIKYKQVDRFVSLANAQIDGSTSDKDVKIGGADFKDASRYNRPNVFRTSDGEYVFCIDLDVPNPTESKVKNERFRNVTSIPAFYDRKAVSDAQIEEIKKVFYFQQEIARENGLDIAHNDQDKIDLYAATQANIFKILNGDAGYEKYIAGNSIQNPSSVSARAKMMAADLSGKVAKAEVYGWYKYDLGKKVTITYFRPNLKKQRTITAYVDNPLEFEKVSLDGKILPGASFEIIDRKSNKVAVDTKTNMPARWTSDGLTSFKINLAKGDYTLRETSAPDGFAKIEDINFRVEVSETEDTSTGIIQLKYPWDDKQPSTTTIYRRSSIVLETSSDLVKTDQVDDAKLYVANTTRKSPKANIEFVKAGNIIEANLATLSNVDFSLRQNGREIAQARSDNKGNFAFYKLDDGEYTVVETRNPNEGYTANANKEVASFTVSSGTITNLIINGSETIYTTRYNQYIITNDFTAKKADIEFVKKDVESKGTISGGLFYLDKLNTNTEAYERTANRASATWNGKISFTGLIDGEYRLWEEEAPTDYELPTNRTLATFTVRAGVVSDLKDGSGNSLYKNEVYNKKIRKVTGGFKIGKTSHTGTALSGVRFALYSTDEDGKILEIIRQQTTDANGEIEFSGLDAGRDYILKEVATAEGYELTNEMYTISLDQYGNTSLKNGANLGSDASFDIANYPNRINFIKTDADSKRPLANVTVELRRNETTVDTKTTDSTGNIQYSKLDDGDYSLVETANTNPDYNLAGEITLASWQVENGRIIKVNAQGASRDLNQAPAGPTMTDGKLNIANPSTNPRPFVLTNKKNKKDTSISFRKIASDTNKPLAGVKLRLWNDTLGAYVRPANGGSVTVTTDSSGIISYDKLKDGKYSLDEYSTVLGYINHGEGIATFTVENGKVTDLIVNGKSIGAYDGNVIDVTNDKEHERAQFTIKKFLNTSSGNNAPYEQLYRTEFTLYHKVAEDGFVPYIPDLDYAGYDNPRKVNPNDGSITFDRLEVGKVYYLAETDANPLYKRMNVVWQVSVDENGNVDISPIELDDAGGRTKLDKIYNDVPNRILFVKEDENGNRLPVAPKAYDELTNDSLVEEDSHTGEQTRVTDPYQDAAHFELYKMNAAGDYDRYEATDDKRMDFARSEEFIGLFGWSDLETGHYKVMEVRPPAGYSIKGTDDEDINAQLRKGFVAEFVVSDKQTKIITGSIKSYNGRIADDYENEIIKVKNDGIEANGSKNPTINITNEILPPVVIKNTKNSARFRLMKVNESNEALENVKFTLTPDEKTKAQPLTKSTDANGIVEFVNLAIGDYTLAETKTQAGYILTKQTWHVNVAASGLVTVKAIDKTQAQDALNIDRPSAQAGAGKETINAVFIVENLRGKSEGVVRTFNESIAKIQTALADNYGDRARIILVVNGHEDGQPLVYSKLATADDGFTLETFDEKGGDGHMDEAISTARNAINNNKADKNYVFILQSGKGEEYIAGGWHYNSEIGFFRPEDNITKSLVYIEDPNADITAYTRDGRSGHIATSDANIIRAGNWINNFATEVGKTITNVGLDEYIAGATTVDKQITALNDTAELSKAGFIITNSADYEGSDLTAIKVINRKPMYPATGGSGAKIGFALFGTAVMITAIAYFGIHLSQANKKRIWQRA